MSRPKEMHVLWLFKDEERFGFIYDAQSLPQLLQVLGKMAADPEHSFTWHDAAVLSQRARRLQDEHA